MIIVMRALPNRASIIATTLAALTSVILPLQAATAAPAPKTEPSFDCRKARSGAEKAICRDPELAQLDRHIAARFEVLLNEFDAASAKALRGDQRWFTNIRDLPFDESSSGVTDDVRRDLKTMLEYRAKFLDSIIVRPAPGMEGIWGNLSGEVQVESRENNAVTVSFNVAEPSQGRWVCDANGSYRGSSGAGEVTDPSAPDRVIGLVRTGARLDVEERSIDGEERSSPFCGLNGSLTGSYFQVTQSAGSQ